MGLNIGDLVFVWGATFIDKAIDWAENGRYSHVALYIGSGNVIEAYPFQKVRVRALADYNGRYDVGHVYTAMSIRAKVYAYAYSQIGRGYGWKTILFLFLHLVLHSKCKYNRDKGIICSVFAHQAWKRAGKPLTHKLVPTPQDLADSPLVHIEKEG